MARTSTTPAPGCRTRRASLLASPLRMVSRPVRSSPQNRESVWVFTSLPTISLPDRSPPPPSALPMSAWVAWPELTRVWLLPLRVASR